MGRNAIFDSAIQRTRNVLGVDVEYTPAATGVTEDIVAPFWNGAVEVLVAGIPSIQQRPQIYVRIADLSVAPVIEDTCTVEGVYYLVSLPPKPDGDGGVLLVLRRAT